MNRPNRKLIANRSVGAARITKAVRYSRQHNLIASTNEAGDYVLQVPDTMSDEQAMQHADIALNWPQVLAGTIRIEAGEAPKPAIELKNIKHAEFASEETNCYSATLYVDGVRWGEVSNEGHGGPDNFHGVDGKGWADIKALDERIAATFPKIDTSDMYGDGQKHEMAESLETICGALVAEWLVAKDLKRALKSQLLFTKPDQPGIFQVPLKQKGKVWPVETVAAAMTAKNPAITILNTMDFAAALAIYAKGQ